MYRCINNLSILTLYPAMDLSSLISSHRFCVCAILKFFSINSYHLQRKFDSSLSDLDSFCFCFLVFASFLLTFTGLPVVHWTDAMRESLLMSHAVQLHVPYFAEDLWTWCSVEDLDLCFPFVVVSGLGTRVTLAVHHEFGSFCFPSFLWKILSMIGVIHL